MYYYRLGANDMVNGRRVRGALKLLLASILDSGRLRAGVGGALRSMRPSSRARLRVPAPEQRSG